MWGGLPPPLACPGGVPGKVRLAGEGGCFPPPPPLVTLSVCPCVGLSVPVSLPAACASPQLPALPVAACVSPPPPPGLAVTRPSVRPCRVCPPPELAVPYPSVRAPPPTPRT